MFVPMSQFHLYGHVTSRGRYGDADDGRDNSDYDEDDDEEKEFNEDYDAAQLTVVCRAARDVRFFLVNIFLILVLITSHSCTLILLFIGHSATGARPR